jgi:hypothetical protein
MKFPVGWFFIVIILVAIVLLFIYARNNVCNVVRKIPIIGTMICAYPSPTSKCGSSGQGGDSGMTACCNLANEGCNSDCTSDTDPAGCRIKCLNDRGCSGAGICPVSYVLNVHSGEKCGQDIVGGASCATACCLQQTSYCTTECRSDPSPNDCFSTCLSDRGCKMVGCPPYYNVYRDAFGNGKQQCGQGIYGGSACKSACCAQQKSYCGSNVQCMKDRGC